MIEYNIADWQVAHAKAIIEEKKRQEKAFFENIEKCFKVFLKHRFKEGKIQVYYLGQGVQLEYLDTKSFQSYTIYDFESEALKKEKFEQLTNLFAGKIKQLPNLWQ